VRAAAAGLGRRWAASAASPTKPAAPARSALPHLPTPPRPLPTRPPPPTPPPAPPPLRYVRHPGYLGWFVWAIAGQLLLANPLCAAAFAYVVRGQARRRVRWGGGPQGPQGRQASRIRAGASSLLPHQISQLSATLDPLPRPPSLDPALGQPPVNPRRSNAAPPRAGASSVSASRTRRQRCGACLGHATPPMQRPRRRGCRVYPSSVQECSCDLDREEAPLGPPASGESAARGGESGGGGGGVRRGATAGLQAPGPPARAVAAVWRPEALAARRRRRERQLPPQVALERGAERPSIFTASPT
jgi:hypothetical protein